MTPRPLSRFTLVSLSLSFVMAATACTKARDSSAPTDRPNVTAAAGNAPAINPQAMPPVGEERTFGQGTTLGNLVVYPVTSRSQTDVGPLLALEDALDKGTAEVREVSEGGSVNTLVIENKGNVPIFVLAGTVVKGGKQDRQIGQDFVIDGKQVTAVDAFCVEHGRWNGTRSGAATSGRFGSSGVIATSKVRAAGQYKKDQSEVWSNVSKTNSVNKKPTASDTFLASVDDAALSKERADLASRIEGALAAVKPSEGVVGIAYAIDGEVRGARWFTHHKVFELQRKKLVQGIALEALTARSEAAAAGTVSNKPAPPAAAVETFVKAVEKEAVTEKRETPAANINEYKESAKAYGSKTMMKPMGKSGSPPAKPISVDVTAK